MPPERYYVDGLLRGHDPDIFKVFNDQPHKLVEMLVRAPDIGLALLTRTYSYWSTEDQV